MNVAAILAAKGRDVATIPPHRTLREAAQMLGERRIGAVVVTGASNEVLGILSERDIVRAVGLTGATCLDDSVSRHMTAKVVTCSEAMDLNDLMEAMTAGRFRHMPVVEDGRLGGIISIGDVVKHRVAVIEADARAMRDYIAMA
jgi:CBS domain-containing protein